DGYLRRAVEAGRAEREVEARAARVEIGLDARATRAEAQRGPVLGAARAACALDESDAAFAPRGGRALRRQRIGHALADVSALLARVGGAPAPRVAGHRRGDAGSGS